MVLPLLKATCLALYALALAGFAGLLPSGLVTVLQIVASLFLAAHMLELVFAYKHLGRYNGHFAASVVLTLLFGALH